MCLLVQSFTVVNLYNQELEIGRKSVTKCRFKTRSHTRYMRIPLKFSCIKDFFMKCFSLEISCPKILVIVKILFFLIADYCIRQMDNRPFKEKIV